jgi:isopentenyldiphosphate isomerase
MGIEMHKRELRELFAFTYHADYNQELSEHELDMVIIGKYQGNYKLNLKEVEVA